jgi:type VI secretion system protein ImpJ
MSSGKLNPVAWMEGMFLRPQHLQQSDLSSDARLRYHLHALNPFHWGVREIAFDEEALAENRIVVTRLEAVLRDGTLVKVPGNARIEGRTFAKGQDRVSVYLALRSWSDQDPNLESEETGALKARNRLRALEIPDANRGGLPSTVEVLEPTLRLLLSGEEAELGLYEAFTRSRMATCPRCSRCKRAPSCSTPSRASPARRARAFAPRRR